MEKQLREEQGNIQQKIWNILCRDHYMVLGLLDLKSGYISFPVLCGKNESWDGGAQYRYEKVLKDMMDERVDLACRKVFGRCASIETIRENMEVGG